MCTLVVAVVRQEEAILFIDQPKLTPEAAKVRPLLSASHAFPHRPQPSFVPAPPSVSAAPVLGARDAARLRRDLVLPVHVPAAGRARHGGPQPRLRRPGLPASARGQTALASCLPAIQCPLPSHLPRVSLSLVCPQCVVEGPSPITMAKACKHPAELEGMRQAHIRDGAALTAFLAWLEQSLHDHAAAKNNGCGKTQPKHY